MTTKSERLSPEISVSVLSIFESQSTQEELASLLLSLGVKDGRGRIKCEDCGHQSFLAPREGKYGYYEYCQIADECCTGRYARRRCAEFEPLIDVRTLTNAVSTAVEYDRLADAEIIVRALLALLRKQRTGPGEG